MLVWRASSITANVPQQLISAYRWEQRRRYAAFCDEVVAALRELAGDVITPVKVPKLKAFPLEAAPAVPTDASGWAQGV